jgi:hypothetical protein
LLEPLQFRLVAEGFVRLEEIVRGQLVSGFGDVFRVEIEQRLFVAIHPRDRGVSEDGSDVTRNRRIDAARLGLKNALRRQIDRDPRTQVLPGDLVGEVHDRKRRAPATP